MFCNLDLLVKSFDGLNPDVSLKNRNEFLNYINTLSEDNDNVVYFISREQSKLNTAEKHFNENGFNKFKYRLRDNASKFVKENKNKNNYFVFVGGKDVDFHLVVNTQSLFIVPTWIPVEDKANRYGVHVDTPIQFYKFILTLNNNNNWYSQLEIDNKALCISLMDARTYVGSHTSSEKEIPFCCITFWQI